MEKSIQRMIFHIPMRINRERASASSIRPVKMIGRGKKHNMGYFL